MTDEEIAAAAADEAARKAAEEADAEAARKAAEEAAKKEPTDKKPTDAEAALLKDAMKHKKVAADAKAALDAATAKLREFDGLDPAELRKLLADKADAERKEAEKRGEYDRIIAQVRDEAAKREKALADEHTSTKSQLDAAQKRIDELTVGYSFTNSKFLTDETVLSGDKARKLYGDHFEIEDGAVIAYDKPRGSSERTPLVDSNGNRLAFEAAIEKIVKGDSDFERIAKSKMRTGPGSSPSLTDRNNNDRNKGPVLQGRTIISNALKARRAGK